MKVYIVIYDDGWYHEIRSVWANKDDADNEAKGLDVEEWEVRGMP